MNHSNKSLAQTFSENERRARRLSLISLCVFLLLTVSNVYFGISWRRSEIKAKQAILSLDSAKAELDIKSQELQNTVKTYSVKQSRFDSLVAGIKRLGRLDSFLNATPVTIYLQYIDSYAGTVDSAMDILRAAGYRAAGKEKMGQANFASAVKYFNPGDKGIAQRIAGLLNSRVDRLKRLPLRIVWQSMAASHGQISIWLGDAQKQDADQIIDRVTQKKDKQ